MFSSPARSHALNRFLIPDIDLSKLLDGGKVFRVPTNAEMRVPDQMPLFKTGLFPSWALCLEHKPYILHRLDELGNTNCPICIKKKGRVYAQEQAIRFVRACRNGHLDDVDWKWAIHTKKKDCPGALFEWDERGTEIKNIHLICRVCKEEATLADVYFRTFSCSGRYPEIAQTEPCKEKMYVILRNASNLRIPEIVSAMTIPPRVTNLHRILQDPSIFGLISSEEKWTKGELIRRLETQVKRGVVLQKSVDEVARVQESDILTAIDEVLDFSAEPDETTLKQKEFQALQHAAMHGANYGGAHNKSFFEVDKLKVVSLPLTPRLTLRICPIRTLRVVLAQRGYRRPIKGDAKLVERFYWDQQNKWYPGVELFGEGIFIDIPTGTALTLDQKFAKPWSNSNKAHPDIPELNPLYVWWHSLSHRIINALAIDSGYSAPSIRERVYMSKPGPNQSGGVLFYATQPGGDGTLGGLISLVPDFSRVLDASMRNLDSCSNDPLCSEQLPSETNPLGAACYACLLLSETSCEARNMFLDRNLLRASL